jgi:hypothetical protein
MPSSHFTKEHRNNSFQQAFQYLSLSANSIFFGKRDVNKNELAIRHSQPTMHSHEISLLHRSTSEITISTLSHSSEISINDGDYDDVLPTPSNSTTTLSSAYPVIHLHNNGGSTVSINELGEDEPWRLDPIINYSSKQRDYFFMDRDEKNQEDTLRNAEFNSSDIER